jgi:hypothetical protein
MGLEETLVSLNTMGIQYAVLESGADGAVLVLPEYGRVLGVWSHWRGDNALWVNPEFLRLLRIGAKADEWMNPGGDRVWLGPEEEFFPSDSEVPPALDPGRFEGAAEKTGYRMENKGETRAWKTGARVTFRISRTVRPLDDERLAGMWGTTWLRQAGYQEEAALEVSSDGPVSTWLWNITQVRAGAEVRIPLRPDAESTCLSRLPPEAVLIAKGCALMSLRGGRAQKIGFAAAETRLRRIVSLEEREAGRAQLVVKDFEGSDDAMNATESRGRPNATEYRGGPNATRPNATESRGRDGALVECRWGGQDASGEFSCASPAVGPGGKRRLLWKTSLCAFSGRAEEVRAFASRIIA